MPVINQNDKRMLLKLARNIIERELIENIEMESPRGLSDGVTQKRGCFVSLHKKGVLRGCIGTIEPVNSLISCVEEHAFNAAFRDPRFPPVSPKELSSIEIEISVLTVPQKITFIDGEDLKKKLKPGIHGVILSRGFQSATFLPQVWEQLPDVEMFLSHLCEKGGMKRTCWESPETTVKVYEVEYFSESEM
jgi:AmmeMemoRadiSam system protein A